MATGAAGIMVRAHLQLIRRFLPFALLPRHSQPFFNDLLKIYHPPMRSGPEDGDRSRGVNRHNAGGRGGNGGKGGGGGYYDSYYDGGKGGGGWPGPHGKGGGGFNGGKGYYGGRGGGYGGRGGWDDGWNDGWNGGFDGKGGGGPGWGGKGGGGMGPWAGDSGKGGGMGWGGGWGGPGPGWGGGGWGGKGDGGKGWGGKGGGGKGWGGDFGKGGGGMPFMGGGGKGGGGRGGGKGGGGGGDAPPHDYRRMAGDEAPVDAARVNELLSLRVGAKRAGDFRTADRIRNDLRALGVAVLDREREWHVIAGDGLGRPDGGTEPYGGYGGAHNMSERFGTTGHDYRRTDPGAAFEVDEAKVNEILAARLHARLNRDFVAADRMRDQLRREHGVEIFDQEREWRALHPPGSETRHVEGKLDLRALNDLTAGGGAAGGGQATSEVGQEAAQYDDRYDDSRWRRRQDDAEED